MAGTIEEAPLSQLIARCQESGSQDAYIEFLKAFRVAEVGVTATGVPEGHLGRYTVTKGENIGVGMTTHAGGRRTVLAYADPAVFAQNYGARFNAGMPGEQVFPVVLFNSDCEGILVNSALAEISILIDRATIEKLVGPSKASNSRPWWKFW